MSKELRVKMLKIFPSFDVFFQDTSVNQNVTAAEMTFDSIFQPTVTFRIVIIIILLSLLQCRS